MTTPAAPCPQIRRLYALDDGDYGYSAAELAPLHALCGTLPAVLAHYYRTLGKHRELNHTQDDLLTPDNAAREQAPGHLVFYTENQGCCVWGIRHDDLHRADPPVWVSEDRQHWQQESATTGAFLLAMAHLQAMFALPYGGDDGFYQLEMARRAANWNATSAANPLALRTGCAASPFTATTTATASSCSTPAKPTPSSNTPLRTRHTSPRWTPSSAGWANRCNGGKPLRPHPAKAVA